MAHKGPKNLLGASGASVSVLGSEGGCKRAGLHSPGDTHSLSLPRLDNVHGSRVEPSETARMNSMDRHIQQTNDRLQCIKQVGCGQSASSAQQLAETGSRGAGLPSS